MDPYSLAVAAENILNSINSTLNLSPHSQQGFEDEIRATLTNIETDLLFSRDILQREDVIAEASAFEQSLTHLLVELLDDIHLRLQELLRVIQKGTLKHRRFHTILPKHLSSLKQNLERVQEANRSLRDLLFRLDSGRLLIQVSNIQASTKLTKKIARSFDFSTTRLNELRKQARRESECWLLQSSVFRDWLEEPGMILWMHGPDPSENSVLSSIVIDHLEKHKREPNSNIGIAFLFLGSGTQNPEQRVPYLLGTLIQQLGKGHLELPSKILAGHKKRLMTRKYSEKKFDTSELSELLQKAVQRYAHTYIILDALDEFSDENTSALLAEAIRQTAKSTHIFMTSRSTVRSTRMFPGALEIAVRRESTVKDFVQSQVQATELSVPERTMIIQDTLDGDIRVALFVRKKISEQPDCCTQLPQVVQDTVENVSTLWSSLVDEMRGDRASMKLLQWVLFSQWPLTLDEIRVAIKLANHSMNDVRFEDSHPFRTGLLTRDKTTSMVRLSHPGLWQYLKAVMDDYCQNPHVEIALVCMKHLEERFAEDAKKNSETSTQARAFSNPPFLDYAVSNWAYHAQKAGRAQVEKTTSFLKSGLVSNRLSKSIDDRSQRKTSLVKDDMSGIHIAAHFGIVHVLDAFLDQRISDVNEKSSSGWTPLHFASAAGEVQAVALLLKNEAGILYETDVEKWTALHIAARQGHLSIVKMLLSFKDTSEQQLTQASALLYGEDSGKRTSLHLAASAGHANIASYLIQKGARINCVDRMGSSPLHHAIRSGHLDVVHILLSNGADPRMRDRVYGQTVTDLAWNRSDRDGGPSIKRDSYEVDEKRSKAVLEGGQAVCRVLKHKGQRSQGSKYAFIFEKKFDLTKDEKGTTQKYLLSEHKILKRLNHPHIVSYVGYDEDHDGKGVSLYMEYCEGGDLQRMLKLPSATKDTMSCTDEPMVKVGSESQKNQISSEPTTPLKENIVWALISQLALAMAYLHHGLNFSSADEEARFEKYWECVIHRDIKPANVVLSHDGSELIIAKLCDLGIAIESGFGKTKIGTEGFYPPEVPRDKWTIKGDIWAFGQTIKHTFKAPESDDDGDDDDDDDDDVDTPLQTLINKCMDSRPSYRPSSIQILERCYDHLMKADGPILKLPKQTVLHLKETHRLLGCSDGVPYLLKAFRHVSGFLDEYLAFDSAAQKRRAAIIRRLQLFLKDGVETLFKKNADNNSKHLTVLLELKKRTDGKKAHLEHLCKTQKNINYAWEKSGFTALHIAVQQGDHEMEKLLLLHGAKKEIRDRHSRTAYDYAPLGEPEDIGELFKGHPSASPLGKLSGIKEEQSETVESPVGNQVRQKRPVNKDSKSVAFAKLPQESEDDMLHQE